MNNPKIGGQTRISKQSLPQQKWQPQMTNQNATFALKSLQVLCALVFNAPIVPLQAVKYVFSSIF